MPVQDFEENFVERLSTGCEGFDWLLGGGLETDVVTTIYGPAGSGKTNFTLIATATIAKVKKVIFIDTEGGFSVERLKQICNTELKKVLSNTLIKKPVTFEEQATTLQDLYEIVEGLNDVGLIILDSAASLYRLEFSKVEDISALNKEFALQLSNLLRIARTLKIPVIVTNQVYTDMNGNYKMVGGDIIAYRSKCLIELKNLYKKPLKLAVLKKHRSLPERGIVFKIVDKGIEVLKKIESFEGENNAGL